GCLLWAQISFGRKIAVREFTIGIGGYPLDRHSRRRSLGPTRVAAAMKKWASKPALLPHESSGLLPTSDTPRPQMHFPFDGRAVVQRRKCRLRHIASIRGNAVRNHVKNLAPGRLDQEVARRRKKPRVSGAKYFGGTSDGPHMRYDRQIRD